MAVAPLPETLDIEASPVKEAAKEFGKEAPKAGKRTNSFTFFKKKDGSKSAIAPLIGAQTEPVSPPAADGAFMLCCAIVS